MKKKRHCVDCDYLDTKTLNCTRTCRTCAFLRRTHFKKSSKHYGRVIWWCKIGEQSGHRYLGSTGTFASARTGFGGCDKHRTKQERRIANDKIRSKILKDTEAARIKRKIW